MSHLSAMDEETNFIDMKVACFDDFDMALREKSELYCVPLNE